MILSPESFWRMINYEAFYRCIEKSRKGASPKSLINIFSLRPQTENLCGVDNDCDELESYNLFLKLYRACIAGLENSIEFVFDYGKL